MMPGSALPNRISSGRNGVTSNCSNVPSSRSRASASALISIAMIIDSTQTRPGRMNQVLSSVGLNQSRVSSTSGVRPGCRSCCVAGDDVRGVALHQQRGVGAARVHQQLRLCGAPGQHVGGEGLRQVQHRGDLLGVERRPRLRRRLRRGDHVEGGRGGEAAHQFGRLRAGILVPDAERHVGHVVGGGVGEQHHLHDRRDQDDAPRLRVFPKRGQLLQHQREDAAEHQAAMRSEWDWGGIGSASGSASGIGNGIDSPLEGEGWGEGATTQ